MADRIYSFLGLAAKAGKLLAGNETCERAIKSGRARLVIVSEDASDSTKKRFVDMCSYRSVAMRFFGEKELLGKYTGKGVRSVIAITDRNFAENLIKLIDNRGKENGGA